MELWSCDVLFQPVFMVQTAQDGTGHDPKMLRKPVPMRLQRYGQVWGRLRDARS